LQASGPSGAECSSSQPSRNHRILNGIAPAALGVTHRLRSIPPQRFLPSKLDGLLYEQASPYQFTTYRCMDMVSGHVRGRGRSRGR
jgi:hypothetical protein